MRTLLLPTAADTHDFGRRVGAQLRAGDLVILSGSLGAGKTALTKGIAEGMGVTGLVTSPTFVIARRHESAQPGGASLIHVDAYRLAGSWEFDDLDFDTDLTRSVVVVEWGEGRAEQLSDEYLQITLTRCDDDQRQADLIAVGERFEAIGAAIAP